jgi:hypothetical protein
MNSEEAKVSLTLTLNKLLAEGLKSLLENKHLYQSSEPIPFNELYSELYKQIEHLPNSPNFTTHARELLRISFPPSEIEFTFLDSANRRKPLPTLLVQNIKLFCTRCKESETFSPTWYIDASTEIASRHSREARVAAAPMGYSLYVLAYQCERCKALPVLFIVKRHEWRLTIEGRSPIEAVEVPAYIPKPETWLLRSAIVAYQSAHTLGGLFYLRAFVEQFARRQTGIKDKKPGEEILGTYQDLLPVDKRDHMPSLKSCYERLSAAIHEAKQDNQLFEQVKDEIFEHFDFRRLYKITDPKAVAEQKPAATADEEAAAPQEPTT